MPRVEIRLAAAWGFRNLTISTRQRAWVRSLAGARSESVTGTRKVQLRKVAVNSI